tara:strand:+ start:1344 stop:2288 length:945 start_codon:yes stop_codon:yes gene_type:complete
MDNSTSFNENLSGPQKACVMMITMGEKRSTSILSKLEEKDIQIISKTMSSLGKISSKVVEKILESFNKKLSKNVEDLQYPLNQHKKISAKNNMWQKMDQISPEIIANYLVNEHPQTSAVVLLKLRHEHAARVIEKLPEKLSSEIISRMMNAEPVKEEVIKNIENTLNAEIFPLNSFSSNQQNTKEETIKILKHVNNEKTAKILDTSIGHLDREKFIKKYFFSLDDLVNENTDYVKKIAKRITLYTLATSLKGSSNELKEFFLNNLSNSYAESLKKEMDTLGPIKLKEVDKAKAVVLSEFKKIKKNDSSLLHISN